MQAASDGDLYSPTLHPVRQGVHINGVLPPHTCDRDKEKSETRSPVTETKKSQDKLRLLTCEIHWPDGQESGHVEHTRFCHGRQAALSHRIVAPGTTTHGAAHAWQRVAGPPCDRAVARLYWPSEQGRHSYTRAVGFFSYPDMHSHGQLLATAVPAGWVSQYDERLASDSPTTGAETLATSSESGASVHARQAVALRPGAYLPAAQGTHTPRASA